MLEKIINILTYNPKKALVLGIAILVVLAIFIRPIQIEGKLSGFYIDQNPQYDNMNRISEFFDLEKLVQIKIVPEQVSLETIINSLKSLESDLEEIFPDVKTQSIHNAINLLTLNHTKDELIHSVLQGASDLPVVKDLISKDKKSFLFILRFETTADFDMDSFNRIIEKDYPGFDSIKAFSQYHIEEQIEKSLHKDLFVLPLVILLFFIIWILITYQRISALIFCLINIAISTLPVFFFFTIFHIQANLVTILVISIVIVLSIADAVHLLTGYNYQDVNENKYIRVKRTLRLYLVPSLLTSVTTAIAFSSFMFSESDYIQQFGLLTGAGVMCEFILTFLTTPFLLRFVKTKNLENHGIQKLAGFFIRYDKYFSFVLLSVLFISAFFISKLTFKTNFGVFLPNKSEIYKNHVEFKTDFHSIIDLEILVEMDSAQTNLTVGEKSRELQNLTVDLVDKIESFDEVVSVSSIKDQLDFIKHYGSGVNRLRFPRANNPYVSRDQLAYRISVYVENPEEINTLNKKVLETTEKYGTEYNFTVFSRALLLDHFNISVAKSLLKSLLYSGTLIFLILLILTRNLWITIISLIANLIPLGCLVLLFTILQLDLNILTSITAVVCLGLIVDDTIHVLYRKLRLGQPLNELGFGMITTTLILAGGYLVFVLSSFHPTRTFGYLSAIVFFVTVLCDLTVLPWLIGLKNSWLGHNKKYKPGINNSKTDK